MLPILSEIEALARQAGEILRASFPGHPGGNSGLQVQYKGVIDPVTPIDLQSEAYLIREIRTRYPDHRILTEEQGSFGHQEENAWIIDPLDGTVNYVHGVPIFSVSIAFAQKGRLLLGVVFDPMRDECFTAERGQGAWLNGHPIHVGAEQTLGSSLLVTGFPYDIRTNPENNLDNYRQFSLRTQGVRRLGSAALDLGYVAAGRFDGYWEIGIKPWDIAAGGLVAEEAGATVTDVRGRADYLLPPCSVLAANASLHPQMLKVLNEVGSPGL